VTTVRVPVRVRIEVTEERADAALIALITDAVDAALGRAVRHARTVDAVRAAAATGSRAEPAISVCLTGDPLPDAVAAGLERSLRLSASLAAARLTGPPTPRCDQMPVLVPGEPRDDDRVETDASGADTYRVPYYDRAGDTVPMRLQGVSKPTPAQPPRPPTVRLYRVTGPDDLGAAIRRHPRRPTAAWFVVVFAPARPGAAVDDHRADVAILMLVVQDIAAGTLTGGAATSIGSWTFPGGEGPAGQTPIDFVDADRLQPYGHAKGADVKKLWTDAFMIDAVRMFPHDKPELQRRWAENRAARLPAMAEVTLFALTKGGKTVTVGELPPAFPAEPLDLLVLTEDDVQAMRADTYGHDCPPMDDGDPGVWAALQGLFVAAPAAPRRAFYGEPAIEDWPPDIAERLRTRVKVVADQLHTSPEPFVGGFLLAATAEVNRRCQRLTSSHAPLTPQLMEMARAFGPIRDLYQEYVAVMVSEDARRALPCPVRGHSRQWTTAFGSVYEPARDDAVAAMFVAACQDILLQTLFATHHALYDRIANFPRYMALTRTLLLVMLSDTADLMALRDTLADQENRAVLLGALVPGSTAGGAAAWLTVTSTVVDAVTPEQVSREPAAGTTRATRGGWRVYDGRGRWWSRTELEALIAAQRQQATAVDALLDKVTEVDELVRKLKKAQERDAQMSTEAGHELTEAVDDAFRELIADLLKENEKRTRQAATDRTLAFGLANFGRSDDVTNELGATLSGIHKLADEMLGTAFTDHDAYVAGVSRLAAEEIGKAEIWEIVNLVGITALAIVCPPAAFVVGAAQAIEGLSTAYEHRDLQRAMLNGDEILSKAQVEAELWSAWIGAALTVIPELPSVARGAGSATRSIVRGEASEAVAAATRQALRQVAKHLAELSVEHFIARFGRELVQAYLINLALSKAMNRIAAAVAEQVAVTGRPASAGDVLDVLGRTLGGGS
jgi:hypothetical protein